MTDALIAAISDHLGTTIGEPKGVLHELIPLSDVHIDIHVVKPTPDRPFYTLVTSGVSAQPMTLPDGVSAEDATPYIELMMCLPADWRLDRRDQKRWGWPVEWLYLLARYPHEYDQFLYVGHTIPNGDPPEPFGPGTDLCCWFTHIGRTVPQQFHELKFNDHTILFIALSAIHESEMAFALADDPDSRYELDQKLAQAGVTEVLDPKRSPVV